MIPKRKFCVRCAALLVIPTERNSVMEPFLGSLLLVAFNFAPTGWAFCNGQLLQISQYTALFSLLGTTYGGDGVTTFALPDLRGGVPISFGQGTGLQNYNLGQTGGAESVNSGSQSVTVSQSFREPLLAVSSLRGLPLPYVHRMMAIMPKLANTTTPRTDVGNDASCHRRPRHFQTGPAPHLGTKPPGQALPPHH